MCLILLANDAHPRYRLVVAANRDEFLDRPTAPAGWWEDPPGLLAGRDLRGGGSWLGVTRGGRFAALTNFRDPAARRDGAPSRGNLVRDFLAADAPPAGYADAVLARGERYNGFNLLLGEGARLVWCSNRTGERRELPPGTYGLSNGLLDTPWPKVERGKQRLAGLLELAGDPLVDGLLELLADRRVPPDEQLPDTGVGIEWERVLAPALIVSPEYGTRSSTVVLLQRDGGGAFVEQTIERGEPAGAARRFEW